MSRWPLIIVFLSIGSPIIRTSAQNFASGDLTSVALLNSSSLDGGDFDGDGDLDLLVRWYDASTTTWKAEILRNTSTASTISFAATGIVIPNISGSCIWIDLNNDSKLDILASGFDGVQNFTKVFLNESGSFNTNVPISSDLATALDWGDIDADGDKDLLIVTATESFILTRTGTQSFSRLIANTFTPQAILSDYDLDSDLDIVGDGIYSNRVVEFLQTHTLFPTPNGYTNLGHTYSVDLDGDGERDIFRGEVVTARGSTSYLGVAYFNQNNIFDRTEFENSDDFAGGPIYPIGAYDFDNNGDVEIAYSTEANSINYFIRFYEVKSKRVTTINLPAFSRFHNLGAYLVADFNGDRKLDIITTGSYLDTNTSLTVSYAKAFRNLTATANGKPVVPTNLNETIENATVTLAWNKSSDAETPTPSVGYNFYIRQGLDTLVSSYATKSGKPRVSALKGSFEANQYVLPNLINNGTYSWAVQSVDKGGNYSAFSTEHKFEYNNGKNGNNYITDLTDQQVNYDPKNDQFVLVGVRNGNVYGVLLDAKFGERKSPLKQLNQFSNTCKLPKVAVDSLGNYLVTWIGDSTSLAKSLWGKFLKSDLSATQANEWRVCEKVFYGVSGNVIASHDATYNPARNSFDVAWIFSGESAGASARRVSVQNNILKRDPIKNITRTYVVGVLHGARGYLSISIDSDPSVDRSLVVYSYEDMRAETPLTSLGKIYFQELDQNLAVVKDSIASTSFSYGDVPTVRYNPYLKNFMVIWNATFQHQLTPLPQDGNEESRDVAAAIVTIKPSGPLDIYYFPATISEAQQQGGSGGTIAPSLAFNYKRNEYLVSWFNSNTLKIYGQRINPIDKTTVTADEVILKESLSEFPKTTFSYRWNHFLLGFLQDGVGSTSVLTTPKDAKPQITSLSRIKGFAGEKVIVNGSNFGKTPFLNGVYFGSIKAKVDTLFWDKTKIQVTVPTGLTREKVAVNVSFDDQVSTNTTILFENISSTGVTGVTPLVGELGEEITITGSNFPADKLDLQVLFGTVAALPEDIISNSPSEIKVKVPQAALRGSGQSVGVEIQGVVNNFGGGTFRVIRPPKVSSVATVDGSLFVTCKVVIISGENFSDNAADLVIQFGDVVVSSSEILGLSSTALTVRVPLGAEGDLLVSVAADDRIGVSQITYPVKLGADVSALTPASQGEINFTAATTDHVDFKLKVYSQCSVGTVNFWTKGISEGDGAWQSTDLTAVMKDNQVDYSIAENNFTSDPIGLDAYFEIIDQSTKIKYSDTIKIYRHYTDPDAENLIPGLRFGGNISDYNIVAMPYELEINKIPLVFKDLFDTYGYDQTKWRIFGYNNDGVSSDVGYQEYLDGLTDINSGKGYWLIARYQQDIFFEGAKTVNVSDGPFEITLKPGWNLIGNPYDFNVSWADILAESGSPSGVESFKTFQGGAFVVTDVINRFTGGFVRNNTSADIILRIPYIQNHAINGGRVAQRKPFDSDLAAPEWRISLDLSAGDVRNELSSFGMHPRSLPDEDERDEHRLPTFIGSLDLSFSHNLSTSIVGTTDAYSWTVEVVNKTGVEAVTLRWDNSSLGDNNRGLFLHDQEAGRLIDMRKESSYSFKYREGYTLGLHFGDPAYIEKQVSPQRVVLSEAYPNPMGGLTRIPFTVVKDRTHVQLGIYNMQGQVITVLVNADLAPGFYSYDWDGRSTTGDQISAGVVVYRLQTTSPAGGTTSEFKKLVIAP